MSNSGHLRSVRNNCERAASLERDTMTLLQAAHGNAVAGRKIVNTAVGMLDLAGGAESMNYRWGRARTYAEGVAERASHANEVAQEAGHLILESLAGTRHFSAVRARRRAEGQIAEDAPIGLIAPIAEGLIVRLDTLPASSVTAATLQEVRHNFDLCVQLADEEFVRAEEAKTSLDDYLVTL